MKTTRSGLTSFLLALTLIGVLAAPGAAAASQVGELVASHIIPRPADGVIAAYLS